MLGTGPFAVPTLRALLASEHQVLLVVTRPPRGREKGPSPMGEAARTSGVDVWSPVSVNLHDSQARLASLAADLLVVCDYGEILKPATLAAARLGGINLHGSLLPKFRGAAPVQWAILLGERGTGNSVIQMTPGLDAGPCLAQQRTTIAADEDAGELEARLAQMGADAVCQVIGQLAIGAGTPIPQDASLASKAPRLTKEQGAIDWSRSAREIKNQVRGLRPWPRAYTFWRRRDSAPMRLVVDRVADVGEEVSSAAQCDSRTVPGTVLETSGRLLVATGQGVIELLEVQPAGKKSMASADFLRGNRVAVGDRMVLE